MDVEKIALEEMPGLAAQVRRALGRDDIALYRISSGTILAFKGDVAPERVRTTPPEAVIRCKEGGGFELSRMR